MLAFVVGVAVGTKGATDDVSAATGTIDALNLGTCTTTNADVFSFDDNCLQPAAFFQQNAIEDLIEVDTLYATYAHDPRTAAESPRAILDHSDHILVSITDTGRDRRDPVVIATAMETLASPGNNGVGFNVDHDDDNATDPIAVVYNTVQAQPDAVSPIEGFSSRSIVAEVVGFDDPLDLPEPEQEVQFDGGADLNGNDTTTYSNSGTYEIIWEREQGEENVFKPIAPDGVVKFFGRVDDGIAVDAGGDDIGGFGPFKDIGANITLDEDVISGEEDEPPVMTLNISVPDGAANSSWNGPTPGHLLRNQRHRIHHRRRGEMMYRRYLHTRPTPRRSRFANPPTGRLYRRRGRRRRSLCASRRIRRGCGRRQERLGVGRDRPVYWHFPRLFATHRR